MTNSKQELPKKESVFLKQEKTVPPLDLKKCATIETDYPPSPFSTPKTNSDKKQKPSTDPLAKKETFKPKRLIRTTPGMFKLSKTPKDEKIIPPEFPLTRTDLSVCNTKAERKAREEWSNQPIKQPFYLLVKNKLELLVFPSESPESEVKVVLLQRQESLGKGASAVLCKAWDLQTFDLLIAKIYPFNKLDKMAGMQEIEPLKALGRYHGHLRMPNQEFIIIKNYAVGCTLGELIDINPYMKITIACNLLKEIIFLHEKGWLHRDIKPLNIIVDAEGLVTLIDFDNAIRIADKNTKEKKRCIGTFGYHASHILPTKMEDRKEYDVSADFCVFGIVLAEYLSTQGRYGEKILKLDPTMQVVPEEHLRKLIPDIFLKPEKVSGKPHKKEGYLDDVDEYIYQNLIFPDLREIAQQFFQGNKGDDYARTLVNELELLLENSLKMRDSLEKFKKAAEIVHSLQQDLGDKATKKIMMDVQEYLTGQWKESRSHNFFRMG